MSFRASDSARRAVRALALEAAALPLPSLDWDRIESSLLAQVVGDAETSPHLDGSATPRRIVAFHVTSPWTVAFASAAAVALIAGSSFTSRRASSADTHRAASSGAEGVQGITLGDTLKPGDSAISRDRSLAYQKAGLVTFTLAPESSIEIVADEKGGAAPGPLTIALGRGSVHAEVTPQAEGEAFAVEVGQTRVAVHGTSFTVSREADRVTVEVTHGSVAVGPTGHPGATQGWLLVGPEHATFSLDGAREAEWLGTPPARGEVTTSRAPSRTAPPSSEGKPARTASAGAPSSSGHAGHVLVDHAESNRPSDESATVEAPQVVDPRSLEQRDKATAAAILKELETCYQRQVSSFGVSFSIRSSLRLSILPSGTIREGVFDPPLSPTLMTCARQAITSVRFPKGESVRQIQVAVNLSSAD
jgi:hypothetical protein